MYDKNKIKNFMKYIVFVPILCTIIFYVSSMTAKAEYNPNDNSVSQHDYIIYHNADHSLSGKRNYNGTFYMSVNVPNNAVFCWDVGSNFEVRVVYVDSNGAIVNYGINPRDTNNIAWVSKYTSTSVDENNNLIDVDRHLFFADYVEDYIGSTLPLFTTLESAQEYLLNGTINEDVCVNYDEFIDIPSPYDISVNSDNEDKYKIYINFKQYIEELNGFHLNYRLEHQIITDEIEENNYDTKSFNNYEILSEHQLIENINSFISGLVFDDNDDMCTIRFQLYNSSVANESIKSNIATVELRIDINGIFERIYGYDGCKDNLSSLLWLPLKSQSGHTDSVLGGNSNTDIPNIDVNYDSSFIGSLVNGFGLLGNNGLFALLSQIFSFIPKEIWTMVLAFLGGAVAIALFKMVTR